MADQNGTDITQVGDTTTGSAEVTPMDKGKGKAVDIPEREVEMEDDDDADEESGVDDHADAEEHEDEDTMDEINLENIVESRTRGVTIDYAEAAKEQGLDEDEDEDDDEDYEEPEEMDQD